MDSLFPTLNPRYRRLLLLALTALILGLAELANAWLRHFTMDLMVFCLPPALALGVSMRWGASFAIAAALGSASSILLSGGSWSTALFSSAITGLGPLMGALLHRRTHRPSTEVVRRARLLAIGLLVTTPVTALLLALAGVPSLAADGSQVLRAFSYWGTVALSLILFTPIVLAWLPEDGYEVNDVALFGSVGNIAMYAIAATLMAAHVLGIQKLFLAGQVSLLISLGLALIPVFVGTTRASVTTVGIVSLVVMVEQVNFVRSGAFLVLLTARERLAGVGTVLFFGAMIFHMLNGIAIRNAKQKRELEAQVYKNPFSGLPNRGYFFSALREIENQQIRKNCFFAEISIPDLNYWGEFSGQELVHRADVLIACRLDEALKSHAHFLAHGAMGSYFVSLEVMADPLEVINVIEAAVADAGRASGMNLLRLRPHVALLRVPANVAAGVEDIQAFQAFALRRSHLSQRRWSMSTLQQDSLHKQRDEIQENEWLVELLARSQVMIYGQLIKPLQVYGDDGLHYEVLARMRGNKGEALSPARFLPVFTAFGLLPLFDREVIRHLFELMAREPGLVRATKVCSINLTGPTLADSELMPFIEAQFAGSSLKPSQVIFEITESEHITSRSQALENVAELRKLGCAVALDDFGTGLASFDYLKTFRPDWIKIDGSFVREAGANAINREVVSSMIRVAKVAAAESQAANRCEVNVFCGLLGVVRGWDVRGGNQSSREPAWKRPPPLW